MNTNELDEAILLLRRHKTGYTGQFEKAYQLGIEALDLVRARQRQEESWGLTGKVCNYRLPSQSES